MTKVSFPHPFCDRYPEPSYLTAALVSKTVAAVADNAAEVHLKRIDQCPDGRLNDDDDISLLNVDGACCLSGLVHSGGSLRGVILRLCLQK